MRNLSGLTKLRFFAAIWVVLFHIAPEWDWLRHDGALTAVINVGYSGVTLFFVLSGFILSYTYLTRDNLAIEFWVATCTNPSRISVRTHPLRPFRFSLVA